MSLDFLKVYKTDKEKIRVGSKDDGGYVIVDAQPYDILISCGIADDVTFEKEFLNKYNNIEGFAFDGTVAGLPEKVDRLKFIKKNISFVNSETTTNLIEYIEPYNNVFLKMDIESYEFRWFQTMPGNIINKIKQIAIEIHYPFTDANFRHFDLPLPVEQKITTLKNLSKTHKLIHLHGNNCCGTTIYNGYTVPNIFECTYIRNDLHNFCGYNNIVIPSYLDSVNRRGIPDIILKGYPFVE